MQMGRQGKFQSSAGHVSFFDVVAKLKAGNNKT